MKHLLSLVAIAVGTMLFSVPERAHATVVFDNGSSLIDSMTGGRNCGGFICADDFIFVQDTTINGAVMFGGKDSLTSNLQNANAFTYFIYSHSDATGPLAELSQGSGQNKSLTPSASPGYTEQILSFDLDTPFNAQANTRYWLGFLSPRFIGELGFNLSTLLPANGLTGQQCSATKTCPDSFFNTTDFIFQLTTGTSATVVPLPAAFPLMAGGLAILGFMGWRRKRFT